VNGRCLRHISVAFLRSLVAKVEFVSRKKQTAGSRQYADKKEKESMQQTVYSEEKKQTGQGNIAFRFSIGR
jgi:hypothetical protein